ncbi:hypothetical protein [Polyangium sp. 15x6]|uniref:hypothetical protein n=1 Tax=Polyangium sp. 15x6 TaxID=3042687 RepID=UPI00249B2991|nr:hypothetical protein [Polyangium sp. 15x6]MDI3285149.1 hypothetical protein [Polyangium sp. 15x6]
MKATYSRSDVNINQRQVFDMTAHAAEAQIKIAQAQVALARERYVAPVRTAMRYLAGIIGGMLGFMLAITVMTKLIGLDSALAIAVVVVAGAAVATPVSIALTRLLNLLMGNLTPPSDKT